MTRKLSRTLVLCALLLGPGGLSAQNGPDNDPDAAPGYTNSVFHHERSTRSTVQRAAHVPIAIGPSYPVGPKLRVQLSLTYNSRVDDYGSAERRPEPAPRSFATGRWSGTPRSGSAGSSRSARSRTAGTDRPRQLLLRRRTAASTCSPDPKEREAHGDGASFYLRARARTTCGTAVGNHYCLRQAGHGLRRPRLPDGYTHDFGRGRDGWYLASVTDPFGNGYTVYLLRPRVLATPLDLRRLDVQPRDTRP